MPSDSTTPHPPGTRVAVRYVLADPDAATGAHLTDVTGTLVEADVIRNDPERLKAAQEKAKKLVEEKKRESEAMARVAEGQFDYPSMKKEA